MLVAAAAQDCLGLVAMGVATLLVLLVPTMARLDQHLLREQIAPPSKAAAQAGVEVRKSQQLEGVPQDQHRLALAAVAVVGIKLTLRHINQAAQAAHPVTLQAVRAEQPTATAPQSKAVTALRHLARHPVPVVVAAAHLTAPTPSPNPATAVTAALRAAQAEAVERASTP
jgi:hypothetical protein